MTTILHLSASTRGDESATDALARTLIDELGNDDTTVVTRRLVDGVPLLTPAFTSAIQNADEPAPQEAVDDLALSDELIAELRAADAVVIGAPIYNFGPPASLKAWADLVARAGVTFRFTESGPEGLVDDVQTFIITASGGVPVGSDMDFASTWLRTFLGFLGITSVTQISADGLMSDPEASMERAAEQIRAATS